jgi:proline iminopeptidase
VPTLHPPIEPYDHGLLDVGDGQLLYWEVCGNPDGRPAVVLHGGPGSGCTPGKRRLFDPGAYRVVLFDQRGAGRSRPHAGDPDGDLSVNTTAHLLGDLELLRAHLGIDRWLVLGSSWGSTLALAHAQRDPERVSEVVLAPVTMTRRSDIDWLYHGLRRFFPAEWARFRDGVPAAERDGDLVAAYARLLADPDPAVHDGAARRWCDWEDAVAAAGSGAAGNPRYADARFRLGFARVVTHYFRHGAWLEEGRLLADAHLLAGVPGVLVHGRLDLGSPLVTAWELAAAWPGSELVVLEGSGHTSDELTGRIVAATDRFAARG